MGGEEVETAWRQCFRGVLFAGRRECGSSCWFKTGEATAYVWADGKGPGEEGGIEDEGARVAGVTAEEWDLLGAERR